MTSTKNLTTRCENLTRGSVGIVGLGMVGAPLRRYLERAGWRRGSNLFLFDSDPQKRMRDDIRCAEMVFICVPTPRRRDGSCDTRIVESVIRRFDHPRRIFVIKSTVEPGTVFRLEKKYKARLFFNPEFLTEKNAWRDFIRPERQIVAHGRDATAARRILSVLPRGTVFRSPGGKEAVNAAEAEMGKYAANVFGALKVIYGNILFDIARGFEQSLKEEGTKATVNYENIKDTMAYDRRIGHAWFTIDHGAYRGVGGHCFPKDLDAFIQFSKKLVERLRRSKRNRQLRELIRHGVRVLTAARRYNAVLLDSQGLTAQGVSRRHRREIEKKRRQKYER